MRTFCRHLPLLCVILCCACTAPAPPDSSVQTFREQAAPARLQTGPACADVIVDQPLTVAYPAGAIYRRGAVLPTMPGLDCLDALSLWLKTSPQEKWQVTLAGEPDQGFDPLALARKRAELLQRYFRRQGLPADDWVWLSTAAEAPQLQLVGLRDAP